MGSVGEKTPTKSKLYLLFSNLGHMEQDKVDVMHFFHYNIGGKIRRLSMNVALKHI
jgi:hypothetical protein